MNVGYTNSWINYTIYKVHSIYVNNRVCFKIKLCNKQMCLCWFYVATLFNLLQRCTSGVC